MRRLVGIVSHVFPQPDGKGWNISAYSRAENVSPVGPAAEKLNLTLKTSHIVPSQIFLATTSITSQEGIRHP
jgi:hypothetical protein